MPKAYLQKEHIDLRGKKVFGMSACRAAAFDQFRKALIDNFAKGWEELMKYDWASTRAYLAREKPNYPLPVVHWMERGSGTGGFDRAFSEVSIYLCPVANIMLKSIIRPSSTLLNSTIPGRTSNGGALKVAAKF